MTQQNFATSSQGWTRPARWLHWGTALAILVEVPAGFAMAWTYLEGSRGGPLAWLHLRASQVHHTLGMILLLAVILRLFWRWRHRAPELPAGTSAGGRFAARSVQALLYALLLLVPLTGWAALSALGAGAGYPAPQMWFFTHDGFGPGGLIPHIVTPRPWNAPGLIGYSLFAKSHVYMVWAGGALLLLHIGGALKHHFIDKDGVLLRMLGKDPKR
ncbi:cytochrome b [Novosphingobium sp. CCH12-A3]|uniref:cytochrome b n=1 Tax=Novosphingobium sp. CCH12-A3 TaxID=1768752 RepID=UPI000785A7F0|nr:cytochrome b/b6 domain-containing protein [Novosphingobium sp. CCH12-A3]